MVINRIEYNLTLLQKGNKLLHERATTAAIILAAGTSSRMGAGRHKLLLPLGDRPVLAHGIEAALASQARPVIVVLGHQAEQVRAAIAQYADHPAVSIIENPDYRQGMSTSLHAGVNAIIHQTASPSRPDSALILLGDQPMMTAHILDSLIAARQATGKRIIAPLYEGQRGNPILFEASLFPELLAVTGDEGARSVIEHHRQEVATVELGSAVATYDVDTWEAYQQVFQSLKRAEIATTSCCPLEGKYTIRPEDVK
ncbi:MAG TPA: nucleotidyltransferase family protein [Ktedonobacteraceae bacterium]|nr:nucleotidyltransferase family protein [Ktedonobacteraceae bacterium]